MENNQRIKVKIGDAEFEAEGLPDLVKSQFEHFLKALSTHPQQASATQPTSTTPESATASPPSPTADMVEKNPTFDKSALDRVFRRGDPLSLLALPKGANAASDAALVLLYGYTKISETPSVTGVTLMKSLSQSGVKVDRVDRTMAVHDSFVNAAGFKRARRYTLNNRGLAEAERLIMDMVK